MKRPIPLMTLLRFPIIFGGFLAAAGAGFLYRGQWLGDIDSERNKLYKENYEASKLIEDCKREHLKLKSQ